MNETILTPRQQFILNLIYHSGSLPRAQIQEAVEKRYSVSKPTLIRDLSDMISQKLIYTAGRAKNTRYLPFVRNPLLRPFALDVYFQEEPDQRLSAKKSFDFTVFDHLKNLFISQELEIISESSQNFEHAITRLSPDILKRELERFTIELAWKSSKIEGNTYTLLETETLLKEKKEAKGRSTDETTMILNHKYAFEEMLKNRHDFATISLSSINQLHNILVRDLKVTTGLRRQAVGITGTVYTPLDNEFQIREACEKTIKIINTTHSPFEKALVAHVMIPYIQPFADGNKRTARMLTNAILMAYGKYPLSYRSIDEEEFKKALILFYEQTSLFHSKRLFVEQLKFANTNYFRSRGK